MYDVYVTIDDVREMLRHCTRHSRQSIIYKIADFCGNWNAHKLLVYDRYYVNYSIYRSLAYEFSKLSKNSKDDFYIKLFNILIAYFNRLVDIVKSEKDVKVISSRFDNINYQTFMKLCDLFFEEENIVKDKKIVSFRCTLLDDGIVSNVEWV